MLLDMHHLCRGVFVSEGFSIKKPGIGRIIIAALCSSIAVGGAAGWATGRIMTSETAIEQALTEHPEILKKAIAALNEHEQRAASTREISYISQHKSKIFVSSLGRATTPSGRRDIVEFIDYNCGVCKSANVDLRGKLPNNHIIVRQAPILGEGSSLAASGAIYAGLNGKLVGGI